MDFPLRGLDLTSRHLASQYSAATLHAATGAAEENRLAEDVYAAALAAATKSGETAPPLPPANVCLGSRIYKGVTMDPPPAGSFAQEPYIYDCFAIVNHYGSIGGGHYTTYANHDVAQRGADADAGPGRWCVRMPYMLHFTATRHGAGICLTTATSPLCSPGTALSHPPPLCYSTASVIRNRLNYDDHGAITHHHDLAQND